VISKILVMFRSLQTSESWPSFVRNPQRGRVDEGGVGEVDDHFLAALGDHVEELLLELGRGVEVDLACERDHVRVIDLLRLDIEVHPLPRVSSLSQDA
jgi:hypothetical protein